MLGLQIRRLAEDTQEQVVLMLLRLTLDVSLTADAMVSSELQWTINAVLDPENFHETSGEDSVGILPYVLPRSKLTIPVATNLRHFLRYNTRCLHPESNCASYLTHISMVCTDTMSPGRCVSATES